MTKDARKPRPAASGRLAISVAAVLAAAPARAQQTSAIDDTKPAPTAKATQAALAGQGTQPAQEIVVTAQKTGAQSIQNVPLTISAINAATLRSANVHDLGDIAVLNPSLEDVQSFGRAGNYLSIRGVSSTESGTPTVQVYVDGFTTGIAAGQTNTTLFDLDRVEILEGPQATLYGANAIGGVINYITEKPSDRSRAELGLTEASYGETYATGLVSGPLVANHLFGEAAVSFHDQDGYLDNTATGEKGIDAQQDVSGRVALRAVFDRTTIDLSAAYAHVNDGCGDCSYVPDSYKIPLLTGSPPYNTSLRDGLVNVNADQRTIDDLGPHYLHSDTNTDVLTVEHDFGRAVLTSITGYGRVGEAIALDLSRAAGRNPNPAYNTYVVSDAQDSTVSEELRLAGGGHGTLRWLAGAYYAHLDERAQTYLGYAEPNPVSSDNTTSANYALFMNAELPIGAHLVLSGGVRFDEQTVDDSNPQLGLAGTSRSDELLPRGTAEYRFNRNLMLYATVSKGYKSGGVNVSDAIVPRTYAPEFLYNYEAGLKGRLLHKRLTYALSAFHMDWTNRQVQLLDASGLYSYEANQGLAHINGAEGQASLRVSPSFAVDAAVTFLDGVIDNYVDQSGLSAFYGIQPDLAGNNLPNAPRIRATLSPQWSTPVLGGAFRLHARADVSYTSERYFDAQNLLRQNPYTLVNLDVGIERKHFDVSLFAKNLLNQGFHSAGELTTLGPLLSTAAPVVFGLRARLKL